MKNKLFTLKKWLNKEAHLKIDSNKFKITIDDPILTSRGERDGGITQIPDPDARF